MLFSNSSIKKNIVDNTVKTSIAPSPVEYFIPRMLESYDVNSPLIALLDCIIFMGVVSLFNILCILLQ